MKFQKGHKKLGGVKKGHKYPATLEKQRARDALQQMVIARLAPMTNAQIAAAEGTKFLVLRDRTTGKFIRLAEAKARKLAQSDYELVEVWDRLPSTVAYADLMNRALDKPKEQQTLTIEGELTLKQAILSSNVPDPEKP